MNPKKSHFKLFIASPELMLHAINPKRRKQRATARSLQDSRQCSISRLLCLCRVLKLDFAVFLESKLITLAVLPTLEHTVGYVHCNQYIHFKLKMWFSKKKVEDVMFEGQNGNLNIME